MPFNVFANASYFDKPLAVPLSCFLKAGALNQPFLDPDINGGSWHAKYCADLGRSSVLGLVFDRVCRPHRTLKLATKLLAATTIHQNPY